MYQLLEDNTNHVMRFNDDGSVTCISFDERNVDYREYLKWLANGNTPLSY